ncbi:hypothetical protein B0H13DRAFT_1984089 [Mycena leptocephala]|nr:hypothetical protein B0H13DRAFT_1984089 [Mycena leptocephala]
MVRLQTLSSIYQLVSVLCVFEIVSGAWTIASFGFGETGESQLMLMFYAAFSVAALYPLTTSAHRTDHRLSRVDKHVQALSVLLMGWFLILLTATIFLFTRGHDRVLPLCFTDTFQVLSVRCTPIVIDLTLPVAIIAIRTCRIEINFRTEQEIIATQCSLPCAELLSARAPSTAIRWCRSRRHLRHRRRQSSSSLHGRWEMSRKLKRVGDTGYFLIIRSPNYGLR